MREILGIFFLAVCVASISPSAGNTAERANRIDLNTATMAELASLPGSGDVKAKAIVEHRMVEPFKTVEDVKKVKGIGEKTFEVLRSEITVGSVVAEE